MNARSILPDSKEDNKIYDECDISVIMILI